MDVNNNNLITSIEKNKNIMTIEEGIVTQASNINLIKSKENPIKSKLLQCIQISSGCILCILFYWQQHYNIVQVRLIHRLSEQLGALFKLFDKIISQRRGGEREQTEYKVILPSLPSPHRSRPGPRDIRDTRDT